RSGMDSKKSRKKSSKNGLPPNGFGDRSTSCDEKTLTTAGLAFSTAMTTGPRRLASWAQLVDGTTTVRDQRAEDKAIDTMRRTSRRVFMGNLISTVRVVVV